MRLHESCPISPQRIPLRPPRLRVSFHPFQSDQFRSATATIPAALRSGKRAVKTLNAIFRRIYKGNLEVLTAWKTATHVQRAPRPSGPSAKPHSSQNNFAKTPIAHKLPP